MSRVLLAGTRITEGPNLTAPQRSLFIQRGHFLPDGQLASKQSFLKLSAVQGEELKVSFSPLTKGKPRDKRA